jgi:predicted GNAT superfamily acetyltransferase
VRPDAAVIKVEDDMTDVIEAISQISKLVALPRGLSGQAAKEWSDKGSLVSGYSAEKYRSLTKRKHFYAALNKGVPAAFLVGYAADEDVDADDPGSVFIRNTLNSKGVIIKQIATHPEFRGKGYARLLYEHFQTRAQADTYAAIVKVPPNIASEAFHRALGYVECATFDHPDGRPRGIWRRPK